MCRMVQPGIGFRVRCWSSALDQVPEKSGSAEIWQRSWCAGVRKPGESVPRGNSVKMFAFNTSGFFSKPEEEKILV